MDFEYRSAPVITPGYRLDRYELLCPIAEGGMAQVWIARMRGKHGFERMVAVKTILPKYASDPQFQKMFLDEAKIASGIEHAHVAQTLDLGEQHGVLFIVMELVDGDALTKLLAAVSKREAKIPPGIILRILADTCGGLHAAHELRGPDGTNLGVVHRDVSPQNILVSARGVAKLIDFGIAKAKDRMQGETSAGLVKGKVKYMAPEQALGRPVDRRVDIWAIGAILYRVIAGRPPYSGNSELETLHALTSGRPPLPFSPGVAPAIANVALRALSHDPQRRFATAAEMQAAMEQAMVDIGATTTAYDVQEFIADHLLDRAAARKQTLELALVAARERDRMEQLLKAPASDSSSGIVDVGSRVLGPARKPFAPPPPPSSAPTAPQLFAPPPPSSAPTAPRMPGALAQRAADDEGDLTVPFQPQVTANVPPAAPTAPLAMPPLLYPPPPQRIVLGSDAHVEPFTELSQTRRRKRFAFAIGSGLGALAVAMLFAIAATRDGTEAHAVAITGFTRWAEALRVPAPVAVATPAPEPAPTAASASPLALAGTAARPPPVSAAPPPVVAAPPTVAVPPAAKPPPVAAAAPRPTTAPPPKKPRVDQDGF